tara:strand:- start:118 stop:1473 length:1356 start_codon:yes stop_codon:yes gene_type:complete
MADTYLLKTFSSAGNRKTFTISVWLKQALGASSSNDKVILSAGSASNTYGHIRLKSGYIQLEDEQGGSVTATPYTDAFFRDSNAWYHLVVRVDTTQGSAADRIRMYKNGTQLTLGSGSQPSQNTDLNFNNNIGHAIGTLYRGSDSGGHWDGNMAQFIFCDGQSYAPSSFGSTDSNGVWIPNASPSITYGSNGFKIDFKGTGASADASGFGADSSGNNNHFATTNIGTNPSSKDSPANNFATLNLLASNNTITEGGLKAVTSSGKRVGSMSSIGVSSGKWYAEYKIVDATGSAAIGLENDAGVSFYDFDENLDWWNNSNAYAYQNDGNKRTTGVNASYGASFTTGDIIGVALDMDNRKLYFSKNGTFQDSGNPASGSTGTGAAFTVTDGFTYFFQFADQSTVASSTFQANFGNPTFTISSGNADANGYGNFEYAVPSGYYALCTKNLAQYGG